MEKSNHKFRISTEARSTFLRFQSRNLGLPPDTAVAKLNQYQNWYQKNGKNFLIYFMLGNPSYTFFGPIAFFVFQDDLNLNNTIWRGAAVGYLDYESLKSTNSKFIPLANYFWPVERSNSYLFLGFILLIISISIKLMVNSNKYPEYLKLYIFLISIVFFTGYFAWWFGSTPSDLGRQQLTFAFGLRFIFIIGLTLILDNLYKSFFKTLILKPRSRLF